MYVRFDIPEVLQHASGFQQYWAKSIFIQTPSNRYEINALTSTYVRLVETALVEYHLGAIELRRFWDSHSSVNFGAMLRSMSHFETCLSNMVRATNCFRRLRKDRRQDPLAQMLRAEKADFASDDVMERFREVRNEIFHLEDSVMKGHIANGQSFSLRSDGPEQPHPAESGHTIKTIDRLVIGSHEVTFNELATWLTEMANFAKKIADYLPSSSSNPSVSTP